MLVVGRRCRGLTPATAPGAVAGYTCGNDVTARDLQKRDGQWTRAKSFDTFCALGPWVVRDAPARAARVSASLDGVEVQSGTIDDMIVAPLELLVFVSGIMTLEPGDVIMTGTPPGVGALSAGQRVVVSVDGVGSLVESGRLRWRAGSAPSRQSAPWRNRHCSAGCPSSSPAVPAGSRSTAR